MPQQQEEPAETIYAQFQAWMADGFSEEQAFQLALESWKSALVSHRTNHSRKASR